LALPTIPTVSVAESTLCANILTTVVARSSRRQRLVVPACSGNAALALLLFAQSGLVVNVGHEKNQPEGWLKVAEATLETTALKPYP
jgi:hypothetical protein